MVESGTEPASMSMIASMVFLPWPKTPSRETSAMSAGKRERTA